MSTEINTKPNIKQAVPFFMVCDMPASLRFYIDGLGFIMTNKWEPRGTIEWCWLQREGAALMLQEYRKDVPDKIPGEKRGVGVSVCFQCEDALSLYNEFTANGLTPSEPFVGNSMWVTCLQDPDGYKLDFESCTDVPEETKYPDWKK